MYLVYIIYCFNENERFIKIGKTSRTISSRFSGKLPYKHFVINSYSFYSSLDCSKFEKKLHKKYKKHKYTPNNIFNGYTECFNLNILAVI